MGWNRRSKICTQASTPKEFSPLTSFRTVELSDPTYEQEGLRTVTVKSKALGHRADVSVWVPEAQEIGGLLVLLHGVYGSHWAWSLKGGVHRSAQQLIAVGEIMPMVIAMPSDALSRDGTGYLSWPDAQDVERWIVEEVPAIAPLAAPSLRADSPIAIGGLSMGGYGALRIGAKYAERFCAISAHSSITELSELGTFVQEPLAQYLACAPVAELNPMHWLRKHKAVLPPLRFDCGTDDPLIAGNRMFHAALLQGNIPHEYQEYSGGHTWHYWQEHVTETLRFADKQFRQSAHVRIAAP
jgi:putative tributyrin esterase